MSAAVPLVRASTRVFDATDLLALICDCLPLQNVFVVCAVGREWRTLVGATPSGGRTTTAAPEAAILTSLSPPSAAAATDGGVSSEEENLLTRFFLPDARRPTPTASSEWDAGARAPVAPMTRAEVDAEAARMAQPVGGNTAVAEEESAEEEEEQGSAPPMHYLHHRATLALSQCPPTVDEQRALLRLFSHPHSALRHIRLRGAAEVLAAGGESLDEQTLRRLETLDVCDCLVGHVLPRDDASSHENPLHRTLQRWSTTPLDHSPEHAHQHALSQSVLARLTPRLHAIRTLNLAHQHQKLWSDNALQLVGAHCHQTLTALNLNFNVDITNAGLQQLDRCFRLRELHLQRLWKLNAEGVTQFVTAIATGWTKLQQQQSSSTETAADVAQCDLRFLNLNELRQRGSDVVLAFAARSPRLAHLELAETNLTRSGLERLVGLCPEIQTINLGKIGAVGLAAGTSGAPPASAAPGPPATSSASAMARHPLPFPPAALAAAHGPSAATFSSASSSAAGAAAAPPGASSIVSLNPHLGPLPPTTAASVIDFGLPRRRSAIMVHPGVAAAAGGSGAGGAAGGAPSHALALLAPAPFIPDFVARQFMDTPLGDEALAILLATPLPRQPWATSTTHPGHSHLKRLDLERSGITSQGLAMLSQRTVPHLEHLALWQCDLVGDEGVEALLGKDDGRGLPVQAHTALTFLLLPHNPKRLTHRATALLAQYAPRLRHLVGYIPCPYQETLLQLQEGLSRTLRSLSLCVEPVRTPFGQKAPGTKLDSLGLRQLGQFASLECLDVHAPGWRDADLQFVLKRLRWLRVLKLTKCAVTDEAFRWSLMDTPTTSGTPAAANETSSSKPAVGGAVVVPPGRSASVYFDPSTIGWECRLELVYLSQLASISSRTLASFASLATVRYLDAGRCDGLKDEQERIEGWQRQWREEADAGKRLPLACTVQF